MRYLARSSLPLLLGAALALYSSELGAQSTPIPRAAAGDTLTLRLAIAVDTVRIVERDTVHVRDTLVVHDTVTVFQHDTVLVVDTLRVIERDTVVVQDTVWLERPDEPTPEPVPTDSIIAWQPIVDPPARYDTLTVGDTVHLTVTGATVTAITQGGQRITRAATWEEITSQGWRWIHSGVGERYDEAPDGTAVTFRSTGVYSSGITHVTLMSREGRNLWRLVVQNVARDPGDPLPPPPPSDPDPIEEPGEPPVLDPCDGPCPEPPPLEVADSLATALEFDGTVVHEAGISYRIDPLPSYPCARLLEGVSATAQGDTIRVVQASSSAERLWCIPYNWPAITEGDDTRARTYPAQPHGERAWYRAP